MKHPHGTKNTRRENRADETPELTGQDASRWEAESGSAGSGASPWGADLTGVEPPPTEFEPNYRLEAEPGDPDDISPDKISEGFSRETDEDEDRYTARPREQLRAITPDLLPTNDRGAREE